MPRKPPSTRCGSVHSVSITYYGQRDTAVVALKNRPIYAVGQCFFLDVCSLLMYYAPIAAAKAAPFRHQHRGLALLDEIIALERLRVARTKVWTC